MQRAVVFGLTLTCVCLVFALSGPSAQKVASGDGGGSMTSPVSVSVANFPASQSVVALRPIPITGSVAVTNLPAVQQVAGTVSVGNLPTDADGNLRVAAARPAQPPVIHFLGLTSATFINEDQPLLFSRACSSEIPQSRICEQEELIRSIPAADFTGVAHIVYAYDAGGTNRFSANCMDANGHLFNCSLDTPPFPVACCGY